MKRNLTTSQKLREVEILILEYERLLSETPESKNYNAAREAFHNGKYSQDKKNKMDEAFSAMRITDMYTQLCYAEKLRSKLISIFVEEQERYMEENYK
jgi:hypothetical protein